jgi:hypothetical protein
MRPGADTTTGLMDTTEVDALTLRSKIDANSRVFSS